MPASTSSSAEPAESGAFDLSLQHVSEVWQNYGGLQTGSDYMGSVDASLGVDLQKLLGIQDARIFIEGYYVGGTSLDFNYTGALALPSAADGLVAMRQVKLYQAYYEQSFGSLDVLLGKYDIQQQFATTPPMELFGNRSLGLSETLVLSGPNGVGTSTYPNTAVGTRVKYKLNDQWTVKFGMLDGVADNTDDSSTDFIFSSKYGIMGIAEVDYTPIARTKLMVGGWGYTGKFDKTGEFNPDGTMQQTYGNSGVYVGGTTRIYTIAGSRGVDAFFMTGYSDPAINLVSEAASAGITVTGLLDSRPTDKFGAAVAVNRTSEGFRQLAALGGGHLPEQEIAFEVTYRARLNDWLVVQPEIDYIMNPALAGNKKEAFVFGLHLELSKLFNF